MTARTCNSCIHWGDESITGDYEFDLAGNPAVEFRRCNAPNIRFPYDRTGGWSDEHDEPTLNYPPEGGAIVTDGSAYCANFSTTGTFGCVLWVAGDPHPDSDGAL